MPIRKTLNLIMLVLFCLSAALQFNDSDGLLWGGIYLFAGLFCGLWHRGSLNRNVSRVACMGAFCATVYWVSMGPDSMNVAGAMTWKMTDSSSEILRESGGLGLIALWMGLLSAWTD